MKNLANLLVTFLIASPSIRAQSEQVRDRLASVCHVLKQAVEKFATFTPKSDLSPMWGNQQVEPTLILVYGIRFYGGLTHIDRNDAYSL